MLTNMHLTVKKFNKVLELKLLTKHKPDKLLQFLLLRLNIMKTGGQLFKIEQDDMRNVKVGIPVVTNEYLLFSDPGSMH